MVGQRDQCGHGRVLRRAGHRPRIESVLVADCGQRGRGLRREVQLAGLDPDHHLHLPDIGQAERALRESQLLTTAFGGREFGFGAGQVGVDVARQRAMGVEARRRIVGDEQHGGEFACRVLGQRVRRDLQLRPCVAVVPAVPRQHAEGELVDRQELLAGSGEAGADRLDQPLGPVQVGPHGVVPVQRHHRREQVVIL